MGLETIFDAQALIDTTRLLSAVIENDHAKKVDIELFIAVPSEAFANADKIKLYLLPSLDGTNYEDGGPTVEAAGLTEVYTFHTRDGTTEAHRLIALNIKVPACNYKWLLEASFNHSVDVTLRELLRHPQWRTNPR